MADVSDEERTRLRAELGIPEGEPLHVTDTGSTFVGGRFEYFGMVSDQPGLSPLWGAYVEGRAIQIRMQRLYVDVLRPFLEWRWQPGRELTISIVCPDEEVSDQELAAIWRHRRATIWDPRAPDGPRPIGRALLVHEFAEAMISVADEYDIPDGRVSWAAMGRRMGLGEDGVHYRRSRAKEAVPPISDKSEIVAAASYLRFSRGDKPSNR